MATMPVFTAPVFAPPVYRDGPVIAWRRTLAAVLPAVDVDELRARRDALVAALAATYADAIRHRDQECQ
jgi:hypothetical protein